MAAQHQGSSQVIPPLFPLLPHVKGLPGICILFCLCPRRLCPKKTRARTQPVLEYVLGIFSGCRSLLNSPQHFIFLPSLSLENGTTSRQRLEGVVLYLRLCSCLPSSPISQCQKILMTLQRYGSFSTFWTHSGLPRSKTITSQCYYDIDIMARLHSIHASADPNSSILPNSSLHRSFLLDDFLAGIGGLGLGVVNLCCALIYYWWLLSSPSKLAIFGTVLWVLVNALVILPLWLSLIIFPFFGGPIIVPIAKQVSCTCSAVHVD